MLAMKSCTPKLKSNLKTFRPISISKTCFAYLVSILLFKILILIITFNVLIGCIFKIIKVINAKKKKWMVSLSRAYWQLSTKEALVKCIVCITDFYFVLFLQSSHLLFLSLEVFELNIMSSEGSLKGFKKKANGKILKVKQYKKIVMLQTSHYCNNI